MRSRQPADGALSLTGIRDSLAAVLAARADDANLHYLDGRALLRPDETGDLEDGLHPGARAYRRMGERFARAAFGAGGALRPLPGREDERHHGEGEDRERGGQLEG